MDDISSGSWMNVGTARKTFGAVAVFEKGLERMGKEEVEVSTSSLLILGSTSGKFT